MYEMLLLLLSDLNGARFNNPAWLLVDTKAIGRGIMLPIISLYICAGLVVCASINTISFTGELILSPGFHDGLGLGV
mgnify:CR=1 FL=1